MSTIASTPLLRQRWRQHLRWVPLLVLLVALAQLSTATHWHLDDHSVVDCSLCLQQATEGDVMVAPAAGLTDIALTGPSTPAVHNGFGADLTASFSIRAPPALLLVQV
ncbi:hypothetical protein HBA55_08675 [Pseudomaricurvus alkylphenolicus]|uniref:hypothetical protein n=1 Tax=Pseudomaricurvus alkylphenolicus TaxID=1306991 RepID=UPI001420FD61|nr:hypothetical protein [Pseudomaricurvus alkylphenolicus]NIB39657.1 hypothetical protein [Pseudomaricurvus alkylphenolicus]